ncbi:MAG: hypothetical protein ACREMN_06345 [Gemmatimonadales bacterium]
MTHAAHPLTLAATVLLPVALAGQNPPAPAAATSRPAATLSYRGFTAGKSYREFAQRARALAQRDVLRCNTSRHTAQLMECGVMIRDPRDSASFYLSAYVLEGKTAMVSLTDSGTPSLVDRTRRDLTAQLGPPQRRERSMLEWTSGRRVVRLNWRGARQWRVISITLTDNDVMDRISKYVKRAQ